MRCVAGACRGRHMPFCDFLNSGVLSFKHCARAHLTCDVIMLAWQRLFGIKYNNHLSLPQRYDYKTGNESNYCTSKQQPNTYPSKHQV